MPTLAAGFPPLPAATPVTSGQSGRASSLNGAHGNDAVAGRDRHRGVPGLRGRVVSLLITDLISRAEADQPARVLDIVRSRAAAMGFDQTTASHHFHLTRDGGIIEVVTKKAGDEATRAQIRTHLQEITRQFKAGDFQKPLAVHDEMPPGVTVMRQWRDAITYRYEDEPSGRHVRIVTADAKALDAVHEFLRYQIREHKTGDSTAVER